MKNSLLYRNLLLSNLELKDYDPLSRKVVLLNILLYISVVLLGFFVAYNFFLSHAHLLALIDGVALFGALFAIVDIRKTANITRASFIATLDVFALMLVLVDVMQGKDFTLIWTVFLPIFTIFINGSRVGLIISTIFYAIVFVLAYKGIDIWQDGAWNMASYVRFVAVSIGLTLITYLFEQSLERAYKSLQESRDLEEIYVESLKTYSITDPLTGLYNRRHLNEQFEQKVAKAKKNGSYFAFFILDIDKFKEYNDTYGHMMGDGALQKVADVLKQSMRRESDSTFRIGGEEFCALFMADEHEKIITSVKNVQQKINALAIEHEKSEFSILTASFGVCISNTYEAISLDKMYKIADENLYKAKKSGRNCIMGAESISAL